MVNFSLLTAEICSVVWGTPANFNGFLVSPSLLQRRRSPEANQTLHDVWPSHGLIHYIGPIHFRGLLPLTEFYPVIYFTPKSCILLYWQLLHGTPAAGVSQSLRRGTTRNGNTELSQRPLFGWAAVTLGIGPHSSYCLFPLPYFPHFPVVIHKHVTWFRRPVQ